MTLFRGLADDLSLDSWLNDHIWPMEANLNGEYCYIGALLGAVELIKSGTTTFSDMYFYNKPPYLNLIKSLIVEGSSLTHSVCLIYCLNYRKLGCILN